VLSKFPDYTQIYTDGSKIPDCGSCGAAIHIPKFNINMLIKIPNICSIYTAECIALREALNICQNLNSRNFIIFSDSLSVIMALKSCSLSCVFEEIILNIRFLLFNLQSKNINVVICWIPSHMGIAGNEAVDVLAKNACESGTIPLNFNIPVSDINNFLNNNALNEWQNHWDQSSKIKGSRLWQIQPKVQIKPWFYKIRMTKLSTSSISRLRIGHCMVAQHMNRIGIYDEPFCECGMEETIDHVLFGCPLYDSGVLFWGSTLDLPVNSISILSLNPKESYRIIEKFIKKYQFKF
jgi:ribonuclease HI